MSTEAKTSMLPYVASNTLFGFIGTLKELPDVPQHVDKDMMQGMSGATQSHLNSALKAMDLISANGQTTDRLVTLVKA